MISEFEFLDTTYKIKPISQNGTFGFEIDGKVYMTDFQGHNKGPETAQQTIQINGASHKVWMAYDGDTVFIHAGGRHWSVKPIDILEKMTDEAAAGGDHVSAPMPGMVMSVVVEAGDNVNKNDPLIVIESMKMETTITASRDGIIEQVHVDQGASFEKGTLLVSFLAETDKEER
jgi:biotin carboxyl carrier protein